MVEDGIIEPCISPWNSPLLAVLKKDKTIRLVNNFSTGLNDKLIRCNYPIAPMRQIFAKISSCIATLRERYPTENIIYSQFDLKNGYSSLSIIDSKRDMTSFIYGDRQVRYARLSQGLSLSPAVFQKFMHLTFYGTDKKADFYEMFNYIDDWALCSIESRHMEALSSIFYK